MDFLNFSEKICEAALSGATRKDGGLNIQDIRSILSANNIKHSGSKEDLLHILQMHFKKPILYYRQEYRDETYGKFVNFAAKANSEIIGYLFGFYDNTNNILHVLTFQVYDQGKGIGSKLLSTAIDDAHKNKSLTIYLDDASDYGPLRCELSVAECRKKNIYIKHGFEYNKATSSASASRQYDRQMSALMTYRGIPVEEVMREPSADYIRRNVPINEQPYVILD